MTPAETARLALIVSGISAAVAAAGLVWQLSLYRLTGARLVVRLIPGIITDNGTLIRGPAKGWGRGFPRVIEWSGGRPWVDVAVIEVVNVGRTAISLSGFSFDVGSDPRWKLWRRHTVGMRPVAIHGGLGDVNNVRVEPADAVFAVFDAWPAIEAGRKIRKRVRVRASVAPAGRRRARSAFRHRWKIEDGQASVWPHGPDTDQVALFQAVWRSVAPLAPSETYNAWLAVMGLLAPADVDPQAIGVADVSAALEDIVDPLAILPLATIAEAIHKHGQAGGWLPRSGAK